MGNYVKLRVYNSLNFVSWERIKFYWNMLRKELYAYNQPIDS